MNKTIIVLIVGIILLGFLVYADLTSTIKSTPLIFDSAKVIPPTNELPKDYAIKMLKDVSIGNIECNDKTEFCHFPVLNGTTKLKMIYFKASGMTEAQVITTRNTMTQKYLTSWLNEQAKTKPIIINIGGNGSISVK
jgi:hypothetical protein